MSSVPDSDGEGSTREVALSNEQIRAAYNPFEHGCWTEFAAKVTQGYMQEELGDWYPLGDHHEEWLEYFAGDRDFVLLCHRDGLKTTLTIIYLLASLEYRPGFRAHWLTNTQDQAFKKAHEEFNAFVERNPWLTELNKPRPNDSKSAKTFANGSKLYAGWLYGGIEGDRSHLLILDDIIKELGDGETEQVLNWIEGVTVPMVKDGGKTAIIGTRKRPDDIYSHLRDRDGYDVIEYPAVLDVWDQEFREDDDWAERRPSERYYTEIDNPWTPGEDTMKVLWEGARGSDYLEEKRSKMSEHLFWREYCLVIRGASGNLIDEADVNQLVDDGGCSLRGQEPPRQFQAKRGQRVIVGHDPAQSDTGDKAAFVTVLIRQDGTRELLDAHAEKGMSPSAIKSKLADLNQRYDPAQIIIEDNGMQQYVVNDALEMGPGMRGKVVGLSTSGQKHSWENGIPRLQTLVENGDIHFYRGDSGTEEFIQAAMSLELQDGKLSGHTPDLIAAWYMTEKSQIKSGTGVPGR